MTRHRGGCNQDLLVRALQIVGAHPDPKVNSSPSWGIRILKLAPENTRLGPQQLRYIPLTRVAAVQARQILDIMFPNI